MLLKLCALVLAVALFINFKFLTDASSSTSQTSPNPSLFSPSLSSTGTNTVYAIGDLHGDIFCALHWVTLTAAVKGNLSDIASSSMWEWIDDTVEIVFVGDYCDKGIHSKQVIELVMALNIRFPNHVQALLGNHELFLLQDRTHDHRQKYYELVWAGVQPQEYLNWLDPETITPDTKLAVHTLYKTLLDEVYGKNKLRNILLQPSGPSSIINLIQPESIRPLVSRELKRLQKSYIDAFGSDTAIGKWLEERPISYHAANSLFVHGGINPKITKHLVPDLKTFEHLNAMFLANSGEDNLAGFIKTPPGRAVYDLVTYRGNHNNCQEVFQLTKKLGVSRIVVGHTPGDYVRKNCRDSLLAIDASLGRFIRTNGNFFCVGDEEKYAENGRFNCEKIDQSCDGDIVRLVRGMNEQDWTAQIVTAEGEIRR